MAKKAIKKKTVKKTKSVKVVGDTYLPKAKSQRDKMSALIDALTIALYDLEVLGKKDPLYVPRCKHKAHNALLACGVTQIKLPLV